MQRLFAIAVIAAAALVACGCQKEIKEIRSPGQELPVLAASLP